MEPIRDLNGLNEPTNVAPVTTAPNASGIPWYGNVPYNDSNEEAGDLQHTWLINLEKAIPMPYTVLPTLTANDRKLVFDVTALKFKFWDGSAWIII